MSVNHQQGQRTSGADEASRRIGIDYFQAAYERFTDVHGSELAAALAYRMVAGLFPFLIFAVAISSIVVRMVGGDEPAQTVVESMDSILSDPVANFLQARLRELVGTSAYLPVLAGFGATVWTGTIGGLSIIRTLNLIHGLEEDRSLRQRIATAMAIGIIVGLCAILAFGVLLIGSLNPRGIAGSLGWAEGFGPVIGIIRWPVALGILMAAAASVYAIAPAKGVRVPSVTVGAFCFAVSWLIASGLLVAYVSRADTLAATYGTLTGIVVTVMWVYLTSLAFVAGAVLDAEYARRAQ